MEINIYVTIKIQNYLHYDNDGRELKVFIDVLQNVTKTKKM